MPLEKAEVVRSDCAAKEDVWVLVFDSVTCSAHDDTGIAGARLVVRLDDGSTGTGDCDALSQTDQVFFIDGAESVRCETATDSQCRAHDASDVIA